MNEGRTEFWDWSPIRPRRFTLVDLMVIVAMVALVCAAVAVAWHSDLAADRKTLVILLSIAAPVLCGSLWFLSGLDLLRQRWLDTLVALAIILLTVADALSILALGWYYPAAAGFICLNLFVLIVYLASWVR